MGAAKRGPKRGSSVLPQGPQRLQRVLAAAGFGSRRACEELIVNGRVAVDGETVFELGTRVDPASQQVAVDDLPIRPSRPKHYVINKPVDVLCTNSDPDGRTRVIDLFPEVETRLFTVGRLDEGTEGLLIVTNDGELAHKLAHPSFRVPRIYQALVAGDVSPETLAQLKRGLYFSDGKFHVDAIRRLKKHKNSTLIELRLSEGKNREIRRLLARVGHKVLRLRRVSFGPLKLGDLLPGEYRSLRKEEVAALYAYDPPAAEPGSEKPGGPNRKPGKRPSGKKASPRKPSPHDAGSTRPSPTAKRLKPRRRPR